MIIKPLLTLASLTFSLMAWAQEVVVVHAPSTISDKEYSKILGMTKRVWGANVDTFEYPGDGVAIKVKGVGFFLVAHDSKLMGPIALMRELLALSKKYGQDKLITFDELSELAKTEYRQKLYGMYPRVDIGPNSKFLVRAMLQREVRAEGVLMRSSSAPSRFGGQADYKKNEDEHRKLVDSSPLVIARSESELGDFFTKLPRHRESVYYDEFSALKTKLILERRGLELFQAWSQNELDRIDTEIQSLYANTKPWESFLAGRTAKSADDLMRIAPSEYERLKSQIMSNYKIYHFESASKAMESLSSAQITYRFVFTVEAGVQGSPRSFFFVSPN